MFLINRALLTLGKQEVKRSTGRMSQDSVNEWLKGMGRYPLLSASQEITLSRTVQRGLKEDATPREKKAGQRAKDKFICCNLRLVVTLARKYKPRIDGTAGMDMEDLLQIGCLGLSRAVDKFDPEVGYKFSTYAYHWIRQAIQYGIKTNSNTIRIPSDLYDVGVKLSFKPENQSLENFAKEHDYTLRRVHRAVEAKAVSTLRSIDKQLIGSEGEASSLSDIVADPDSLNAVERLDYTLAVEQLEKLGDPDDVALVALDAEGVKPKELGELLGVSMANGKKQVNEAKARLQCEINEFAECLK